MGSFAFSTDGLGVTPGNPLSLIQASENLAEAQMLSQWFDSQWAMLRDQPQAKAELIERSSGLGSHRDASSVYALMLHHLCQRRRARRGRIVKSATGIRNTVVWKKLYKFQRDGVVVPSTSWTASVAASSPDSVGLSKTFEALAIIKYHELRNDRVLVLCPKRLRDNWTLYKANDRRNVLASDRFNYDVLNHRPVARRRSLRRHRSVPCELGQLRPGGDRRVAQLPQQKSPRQAAKPATTA